MTSPVNATIDTVNNTISTITINFPSTTVDSTIDVNLSFDQTGWYFGDSNNIGLELTFASDYTGDFTIQDSNGSTITPTESGTLVKIPVAANQSTMSFKFYGRNKSVNDTFTTLAHMHSSTANLTISNSTHMLGGPDDDDEGDGTAN